MIVIGYNGFTNAADVFGRLYGATGIDRHSILGHDAAVAAVVDGELVAAVEQERLNREKKTSDFPVDALRWCLDQVGAGPDDVDVFALPWRFSREVVDGMLGAICAAPSEPGPKIDRLRRFGEMYTDLMSREAIRADFTARTGFELPDDKLVLVPHHFAHLRCGHHLAGGGDAAFLVSDGRAEAHSAIMGEVRGGEIRVFGEATVGAQDSLALLYGEITRYLGFMPNNDEYKVMGLAAYADEPTDNPLMERVVTLHDSGGYTLSLARDPRYGASGYYPLLDELFGGSEGARHDQEFRARVARAAQDMVEQVTAHQVAALAAKSDLDVLLLEGGLALNCVNNTKLLETTRFADLHVSFGASDPGVAIGAALHASADRTPSSGAHTPYLGPSYDDAAVLAALERRACEVRWTELPEDAVVDEVAKLLVDENVVGWFQGRTEYGPRALGNRSILANPSFPDIKDVINTRVKHREPFRPFAPIVLDTDADTVFAMGKKAESPYMTFVFDVRPDYRDRIVGATHIDGTSRVQTVSDRSNPVLAALLRRFTELTGVPCLINTSFNVAGEPIVNSPDDAIACFLGTEIDHLVLGRFLVGKASGEPGAPRP